MGSHATRFSRLVVTVPGWLAEPYGSALVEVGAGAVEQRDASEETNAELVISLPEDEPLETWRAAVDSLSAAFAEETSQPVTAFSSRVESVELDYHAEWLDRLTAQQVTKTLWFAPANQRDAVPADSRCLLFEPHPSFGDGSHPTTRMAAQVTETYCLAHPGCSVLDVGTGNGVLSLVGAVHGANAYGIDIDAEAVAAAAHNARLNRLEQRCRFEACPLESIVARFDLVVANLEPRVHFELSAALAGRLSPSGTLLLTGFLEEHSALIADPLRRLGLRVTASLEAEGYLLLGFERNEASPRSA